MKIDFVSDVACPWCAVGLNALERALERIGDGIDVELHFRPFELNPQMEPEGEDAAEHLARKYGLTPQRVWNTFDAHRLLYWAGLEGRQRELKHALLRAYHGRGENPGAHDVLLKLAREVGLDVERAREVLESGRYAAEVRAEERHWQELGIHAVPSVIVDDRHLIQGGQPPDVFERALRQLAGVPA